MFKKWLELIFDHKISLRERMFRVVTGICMVALMFVLPMGRSLLNMLILAVSLICIALIVKVSIQKKCINRGGYGDCCAVAFAVSGQLFYSGRILQRHAGMVCSLFCLHQRCIGGKEESRIFRALYGGNAALLLYRLLFSGICCSEYAETFLF